MIYALFRTGSDCEAQPELFFASYSKRVVDKKLKDITTTFVVRKPFFDELQKSYQQKFNEYHTELPPLDLKNLPPRDLVWKNHQWNNAYVLERDILNETRWAQVTDFQKEATKLFNREFKTKFKSFYEIQNGMDDFTY